MKKLLSLFAAMLIFAATFPFSTQAADFPNRPVTVVVPFGTGGGSDMIARALSKPLEKELGKPIVVLNKPGGSGTVGTSYVAHAKPDGYTIGLINNTGLIHQIHYGGVDYKPEDLDPLCLFLRLPVMLVVNSNSPIKNVEDFVKAAKEKKGALTVGTAGIGGGSHMAIAPFFGKADIEVQPMPFKNGAAGVITALVGGHVDAAIAHPSEVYGQYKAGNLRILGVLDDKRLESYPDVPTFKEQGYDVTGQTWRAFLAPHDTPEPVKEVLIKALKNATEDPEYRATLAKLGEMPVFLGPEEFKKYLKEDDAVMLEAIKRLNMYNKNVKQ